MISDPTASAEALARALKELSDLRQFAGAPRDFWSQFQACLGGLVGAQRVALLLRDKSQPPRWRKIGEWSSGAGPSRFVIPFATQLETFAERAAEAGGFVAPVERSNAVGIPFVV